MSVDNTTQQSGFGQYRGLAISIVLLVLVVISLLTVNLFLSSTIREGSQLSSIVNRQAALINQVSKDLFLVESRFQFGLASTQEILSLKESVGGFNSTLDAFINGGTVEIKTSTSGDVQEVVIVPFTNSEIQNLLFQAQPIWSTYYDSITPVFDEDGVIGAALLNAKDLSDRSTQRLVFLMESVASQVQIQTEETLSRFQIAQYVGIVSTIFMFVWTIFVTVGNLRKNDKELDRVRQESAYILDTVRDGLFLLDENIEISSQYSNEMENIFETTDISGRPFTELLSKILTGEDLETVEEFVKLLFDEDKIESLIESLNPLEQIEVNFFDPQTRKTKAKYLSFVFYRVMNGNKIVDVLVSVRDVSNQVYLQEQLEYAKKQSDQQVDMLVSFLQADPAVLNQFLSESRRSLNEINDILKEPVSDKHDFQSKVEKMFIQVHRMKGEAGSMKFYEFAERAHEFEEDLTRLRKVKRIEGIDFLPLVIELDKLISYTDSLHDLHGKIGSSYPAANTKTDGGNNAPSISSLAKAWDHLPSLVDQVSIDTGKKINFVMTGLVESDLSSQYRTFINDISIQLLRNSIIHGIESPGARKQHSKGEVGRIDLRLAKLPDGSMELIVRDDGCGLDVEKIRDKVIESGIASEKEVADWPTVKVVSMVFKPGFSTAETTTMHAGRGVGLDVIKQSVTQFGGKLRVNQAVNKYCQFEIILPPMEADEVSAA